LLAGEIPGVVAAGCDGIRSDDLPVNVLSATLAYDCDAHEQESARRDERISGARGFGPSAVPLLKKIRARIGALVIACKGKRDCAVCNRRCNHMIFCYVACAEKMHWLPQTSFRMMSRDICIAGLISQRNACEIVFIIFLMEVYKHRE
jgi:hypothetical protein